MNSLKQGRTVGAVNRAHVKVGAERLDRGGRELFCNEDYGLRHSSILASRTGVKYRGDRHGEHDIKADERRNGHSETEAQGK